MTAQELIAKLQKVPPGTPVVLSGSDHTYYPVSVAVESKAEDDDGELSEYYGERNRCSKTSRIIKVVVVG